MVYDRLNACEVARRWAAQHGSGHGRHIRPSTGSHLTVVTKFRFFFSRVGGQRQSWPVAVHLQYNVGHDDAFQVLIVRSLAIAGVDSSGRLSAWPSSGSGAAASGPREDLDGASNDAASRATEGLAEAGAQASQRSQTAVSTALTRSIVRFPEAEWSADDCFKLGSALVERKRLVLGWAALEAAQRIDAKHAPSVRALDALQGKLSLATGSERSTLHEAASRGELLRLIGKRGSAGSICPGPRPVCE